MSSPEALTWNPEPRAVVDPAKPTLPISCDCQVTLPAEEPPGLLAEPPPPGPPQPTAGMISRNATTVRPRWRSMLASSGCPPQPRGNADGSEFTLVLRSTPSCLALL